jgi:hypothetical protein
MWPSEKAPGWIRSRPGRTPSPWPMSRGSDQAPVRHRKALRIDQGKGDHHDGGGPEPDVGRPVLSFRPAQPLHHLRGAGVHGVRPAGRHRRPDRLPDELVVDIAGDGSIQMNIQEMATAVQYGLPVKVVILNNGYLGMVSQWQELFYEKRYACTCMDYAPISSNWPRPTAPWALRATRPEEVVPS